MMLGRKLRMNAEIRKARPDLKLAAPLTFWVCIGFALLNVALFFVIFTQPDNSNLALYFSIFTPKLWATLFLIQALVLSVGIKSNSWKLSRGALGVGLFIKSFYAYSLIDLGFRIGFGQTLGITSIWLFLAWVQFFTIVHFVPPIIQIKGIKNG